LKPLLISRYTATSCIGTGLDATRAALADCRSGLRHCDFETITLDTWIGRVPGLEAVVMSPALADYDCRNNRLALLGLMQDGFIDAAMDAVNRYGAKRVAVLLGTSTSGILETELAYRHRDPVSGALPPEFHYRGSHNIFSVAEFVRHATGAGGPAWVISTACSSSAKVFASASRMLDLGLIDAAIVGGVDSLCLTTLYGFNSLELVAPEPCRPFDPARSGISIGEAAAFALLERAPARPADDAILLTGYGESSDAYHMSSPHPDGLGARMAMEQALARAGLDGADIDYINLHGTGTPSNDSAEGAAVHSLIGKATPASSTKGATGHTLGAAGGLEAVFCALALNDGLIPGSPGTRSLDPDIDIDYRQTPQKATLRHVLSNSLGFGGTNCSLVLSRAGGITS
jgi:3-oxoacyl-[acyl-carrier-protein] synthase-1